MRVKDWILFLDIRERARKEKEEQGPGLYRLHLVLSVSLVCSLTSFVFFVVFLLNQQKHSVFSDVSVFFVEDVTHTDKVALN